MSYFHVFSNYTKIILKITWHFFRFYFFVMSIFLNMLLDTEKINSNQLSETIDVYYKIKWMNG